jgi:hypothetical protein
MKKMKKFLIGVLISTVGLLICVGLTLLNEWLLPGAENQTARVVLGFFMGIPAGLLCVVLWYRLTD